MRFEILSADLAPRPACFEIVKGHGDCNTQFGCISHAESRAADFEYADDLARILEMRPEEYGAPGVHRLDEIVSSDRRQRPSNERNRGRGIHRCQFTERVENQDLARNEMATFETTTQVDTAMALTTYPCQLPRALDLAWCKHENEAMPCLFRPHERVEQRRLLVGICAAAHHHRHVGQGANQIDRERGLLRRWIEFQITGHANTMLRHAEFDEALGIDVRSRTDRVDPSKRRTHQWPDPAIAGKGMI